VSSCCVYCMFSPQTKISVITEHLCACVLSSSLANAKCTVVPVRAGKAYDDEVDV
jgi:hypothetical protein